MTVFNKVFRNSDYEIFFNTHTGFEIIRGINGKEDPFSLYLPSLLDIGIMGHCKHKCKFCYQGHITKPNMKLEDFKTIIDQVKHHTNQVALGGRGDPNHHENFREIISYSRTNGVVPNYTTSGIDITDEQIQISKMCGAVAVSDYGKEYTYEALKKFMDAEIKTNIHLIFSKQTFDKCMDIVDGVNPWGSNVDIDRLNAVIFLLFKPAGAGASLRNWRPDSDHFIKFASKIFEPKSKFKIGMDSCLINHVLQYTEPSKLQRMSIDTCEGARMSAYITPDMKMSPCSFADESIHAIPLKGNHSIEEVWNLSLKFKSFRNMLQLNQKSCPLGL